MNNLINRFLIFIGTARARSLFFWLALTGGASLGLNAVKSGDWVRPVQTLLLFAFIIGAIIIIGGRMDRSDRSRFFAILAPAVGALLLAVTVLPQFTLPLAAGAVAWVVAGFIIFRNRIPMDYQKAIKHLRKNEYAEAIDVIDDIIKDDPDTPGHYQFRAEVLRISGKLDRARRDYYKMIDLEPESPEGYNGLAEVQLQMGNLDGALEAAEKARALAPEDWVALYNLGMIEDRVGKSDAVIEHLTKALSLKVNDSRHRLLIFLYLARAYARLGKADQAQEQIKEIKKTRMGLDEWQKILESDQAATLKNVIGADVELAQGLADGTLKLDSLIADGGSA